MSRTLYVYLHANFIGRYTQDLSGQISFVYDEQWLNNANAIALSISLPLREEPFTQKECRAFFAGLLPEDRSRELIAQNLGISSRNDYAMLGEIGGDCAGAVTFLPPKMELSTEGHRYQVLSERQLAEYLREIPNRPLLVGGPDLRLSLAGVQSKMVVSLNEKGQIALPLGGAPSTCILKPAIKQFPYSVHNEALCLSLAKKIGIPAAEVRVGRAEEIEYILVHRYDREGGERLHQEDFCQALGVPPERKYQGEGGPNLKNCFELLRQVSTVPAIDIQNFINIVFFNVIVGNHDAHGKNFSLIYKDGKLQLAPAYDILSTVYYPSLTSKMAMKLGGEYKSDKLKLKHIEKFARDIGLNAAGVCDRAIEIAQKVRTTLPEMVEYQRIIPDLVRLIDTRADQFIKNME